jgi:hypothetical protein
MASLSGIDKNKEKMNRLLMACKLWGLLTCIAIVTTACKTAPFGGHFKSLAPVEPEMADIYIYRNESFKIQKRFSVKVGNGNAAYLFDGSFLFYRLAPGPYEIVVSPGPMMFNSRLHIDVKAGEQKFYEYSSGIPNPFLDFAIGSSLGERTLPVALKDLSELKTARVTDVGAEVVADETFETTNFAGLSDISSIPYVNSRARENYRMFLRSKFPRAFVIADDGGWAWSAGLPNTPSESKDPLVRALQNCTKLGHKTCKPYAIDGRVVWK